MKYAHIPVLAALCALAACATTPERVPQLEEARAKVQALAQDPMVQQAASEQLADARNTLQQAEIALEKREPVGRVTHLSYLAARHADIGQARLDEARARAAIAKAEAERNRVLLAARSQEAEAARLATEDARRAAEDARRATEAARLETSAAQIEAQAQAEAAESARRALAELQAKETERGMVLTLSDVLFDSGAATLKPGAIDTINRLATFSIRTRKSVSSSKATPTARVRTPTTKTCPVAGARRWRTNWSVAASVPLVSKWSAAARHPRSPTTPRQRAGNRTGESRSYSLTAPANSVLPEPPARPVAAHESVG